MQTIKTNIIHAASIRNLRNGVDKTKSEREIWNLSAFPDTITFLFRKKLHSSQNVDENRFLLSNQQITSYASGNEAFTSYMNEINCRSLNDSIYFF